VRLDARRAGGQFQAYPVGYSGAAGDPFLAGELGDGELGLCALGWLAGRTRRSGSCISGRVPAGLWARIVQRLLALNAAIWHNWLIGAPVKRSLIAYDHV
jgi:hypothetical protein